jgi:hypothetical protein
MDLCQLDLDVGTGRSLANHAALISSVPNHQVARLGELLVLRPRSS